ncbi:hypothetical protein SAMN02799631_02548 [Methylobacterium sp. 174MFSha1.1]|uniref:hypothetical protein n=1 Tax=Methylobacterium sp. 174MFSha1.1 TaxID=1502749 RepID=UPI0008F3160D|nr:hypothetical protein [Methylobacterium sp. 174MFSha1.1]SFU82820.1 hypothetical protein SAMN02799631_02548 [Methylobacterium sp. 174MFSha1.1]
MPAADDGPDRDGMGEDQAAAGQAALMLVESLMLALVERGVVPADDLIEAVETVIETKRRLVEDGHEPAVAARAAAMLATIANSLAAAGPATKG